MEGEQILLESINNKIKSLKKLSEETYIVDNIDMIDLLNKIDNSIDNLIYVSDNIINKVAPKISEDVIKLRDLLIGKNTYGLKVNISIEYNKLYKSFRDLLKKDIEKNIENYSELKIKDRVEDLLKEIEKNSLINDYDLIMMLVKEYDLANYDKNMITVMEYVIKHNEDIYNTVLIEVPDININLVSKELDPRINEVLDYLKIEEIPDILLRLIYECDVDTFVNNFELIKKNKVEQYGILHLLDKNNTVSILSLLCLSDVDVIKSIVDSVNKQAKLVKILLNNCISVFFSKVNNYFISNYDNYIKLVNFLRTQEIDITDLILKCPIIFLTNAEIVIYALIQSSSYGIEIKKLVNKCYKVFAYNPMLISTNLGILKNKELDLDDYLKGTNLNLLKVTDLEKKINQILKEKKISKCDELSELLLQDSLDRIERD